MGRKQNRTAIWNSFKHNKKLIRDKGNTSNSNVFIIDPEEQKKKKLARKLAEQLKPKQPSKKQLQKLKKLREKKAQQNELKSILSSLAKTQLTNKELALMVATKHKETKKERLKRLYLTKKAGIDIDDSELYIIKSTPSQIMHLKENNTNNQLRKYNDTTINNAHFENENENESSNQNTFEFGTLSVNQLNTLIPGAEDKEYKLKDGIKVISTRKTPSRKRKKKEIVLMDITDKKEEQSSESSSEIDNFDDANYEPPKKKQKKRRQSFGGLKSKTMVELQGFLECDSDDETLVINSMKRKRKFTVKMNRLQHIIESRMQLPIIGEEYKIMECINNNDVVLICGETGSGKSTQVPQFLYEAGYSFDELHPGMIGVTEPRRVAAMSVSKRVGIELNNSKRVSYQIRYDSQITKDTHIKFMTDGILLREIQFDFLLNKYCVIILDEAHERNLNTDVLIGLLSRIVKQRRVLYDKYLLNKQNGKCIDNERVLAPLKLIIMSATLKVEDFSENPKLFNPSPPLVKIPSRQYPVTIHFNKTTPMTEDEYEEELFQKICKIHILLPKGHILVFLTGRRQIEYMCNRLRQRFNKPTAKSMPVYEKNKKQQHYQKEKKQNENENKSEEEKPQTTDSEKTDEISPEDTIMNEHKTDDEDDEDSNYIDKNWQSKPYAPVNILPLYSLLSPKKQGLVFDKQKSNNRLIVIATNIAETSITIPGIRYVVDCGRVKQEKYSAKENMSKMVIEFISKSSAKQRAGRSGRTGPGHCYRLYSANFYDKWMIEHFEPEILRVPIENIILIMKAMNIKSISKFPFATPPKLENIFQGLRILEILGALKYNDIYGYNNTQRTLMLLRNNECLINDENKLEITKLGKSLIEYPINVRLAKMLILGFQGQCLPFVLAICCLLSVESLQFLPDEIDKILQKRFNEMDDKSKQFRNDKEKRRWYRKQKHEIVVNARHKFANNKSDILSYLNIFGAYKCYKNIKEKTEFCKQHYIRSKNIYECNSLMIQLQKIIYKIYAYDDDSELGFNIKLPLNPPSNTQQILLRQIVASGLIDQIARKWPNDSIPNDDDWVKSKRNYLILKKAYQCMSIPNKPVFIHPSSYIYSCSSTSYGDNMIPYQPEFVIYFTLHKSETVSIEKQKHEKKIYMHHITVIESHWLLNIAPHLCIVSDPLDSPKPFYDKINDEIKCYVEVRFGPFQWELPMQTISYPNEKIYYWFGRLLLEGQIFEDLKCIKPYLQYRTNIITDDKYSIVSNKAVIGLIDTLKEYKIDSKHKLKLSLTKNPNFLYEELKMFMYNIKQYVLKKVWPPTK